jgi:hypothetical protein
VNLQKKIGISLSKGMIICQVPICTSPFIEIAVPVA